MRSREHDGVNVAATAHSVAVFAPDLATLLPPLAAILPLLPPVTRNVTFMWATNRLECGIREESDADAQSKSGKNGNVDWDGQHCRPGRASASCGAHRARRLRPRRVSSGGCSAWHRRLTDIHRRTGVTGAHRH